MSSIPIFSTIWTMAAKKMPQQNVKNAATGNRHGAVSGICFRHFFSTGTFGQPEVDSVNSRAEKHQMTNFLPLIQLASLAALR